MHERSHRITVVLDVPRGGAEGIVLSDGGPEGGYALVVAAGKAHYVTNFLGRRIGVATSDQALPSGTAMLGVDVEVPSSGRVLVTMAVNGVREPQVELTAPNPVSYDVRGRGLRTGSGLAGVWPSYVPALDFNGEIVEVRIAVDDERDGSRSGAKARVAMTEQ